MEHYLSLFDFLGRAAGAELGKAVAFAASKAGITTQSHEVSNAKYTGTIKKYPISFLDEYFRPVPAQAEPTVQVEDKDRL